MSECGGVGVSAWGFGGREVIGVSGGVLGEIGLHLGVGGGRLMAEAAAGSRLLAVCRHVEAVMSWLAHHD